MTENKKEKRKLDAQEQGIFDSTERDFKDHVVENTGLGRWEWGKPGTNCCRMFITELPQDNLVITGDYGDMLFKCYRGIHWLKGQVRRLLEGEGRASWGYIAQKLGTGADIYEFCREEYDERIAKAKAIVALSDKLDELQEKEYSDTVETEADETQDAIDKLFRANHDIDDVDDAKKIMEWLDDNQYGEPGDSADAWISWCYNTGFGGEDYESIPSFKKYSSRFYLILYAMARFFASAPIEPPLDDEEKNKERGEGAILGSFLHAKRVAEVSDGKK